tara:strand:- start:413 stop:622 length:210 start_codon:yes stop_codon:yes gene_type:complete
VVVVDLEVIMVHLRARLVDLVVVVLIIQHQDLLDLVVVQAILEIQAELENGNPLLAILVVAAVVPVVLV